MAITAADVNKLRQQTGIGMMDCKKALVEADGDFEKAIDILRKKGQKVAAKRADRESNEGRLVAKTNAAHHKKGESIDEHRCSRYRLCRSFHRDTARSAQPC